MNDLSFYLGDYEVFLQKHGFYCIRQRSSGETMHSVIEPSVEAKTLYVDQSGLLSTSEAEYVIWDVGLGAATNAVYTLEAFDNLAAARSLPKVLRLISFERDLDSLRLAFLHPEKFPQVRHRGIASLLDNGRWRSEDGRQEWVLLQGDFLEQMTCAPKPHCVYFDPFSRKTDETMWGADVFQRIFACRSPAGTRLISYSVSTRVRKAMLDAGFILGIGAPSGPKPETTLAFSSPEAVSGHPLFPEARVVKWRNCAS